MASSHGQRQSARSLPAFLSLNRFAGRREKLDPHAVPIEASIREMITIDSTRRTPLVEERIVSESQVWRSSGAAPTIKANEV